MYAVLSLTLAAPALLGVLIRVSDAWLFDVNLLNAGLSHGLNVGLLLALCGVALCVVRRPAVGLGVATLLFALTKGIADSVSAPTLECGGGRCTSIVTGANSGIGFAYA